MNRIIEIHYHHKQRYGYCLIALELNKQGVVINHKKVKRLMSVIELYGVTPKSKYQSYKGNMNGIVRNQLLYSRTDEENHKTYYKRNFHTSSCDEKWATDVSEFHIAAGKFYLSPIRDLHNRKIISYSISSSPNFSQTIEMLDKAFEQYTDLRGLILHSD